MASDIEGVSFYKNIIKIKIKINKLLHARMRENF